METGKPHISQRQLRSIMAFVALFLTVFLSCNVKKGLQTFFGTEVTKPLNVSKTTLAETASCQIWEDLSVTEAPTEQAVPFPFVAALFLTAFLFPVAGRALKPSFYFGAASLTGSLPLFLLYRKLII